MRPTLHNFDQNQAIVLSMTTSALTTAQQEVPALIKSVSVTPEGYALRTVPSRLRALAFYVRNSTHLQFRTLVDVVVVDRMLDGRFVVNYIFLSTTLNQRLTIQVCAPETEALPSLSASYPGDQPLFPAAAWLEREVWDMFGIYFSSHATLGRILTDYGFTGHPLRKDFPLTGFNELIYSDTEGRVVAEPVALAQEYRVFHL